MFQHGSMPENEIARRSTVQLTQQHDVLQASFSSFVGSIGSTISFLERFQTPNPQPRTPKPKLKAINPSEIVQRLVLGPIKRQARTPERFFDRESEHESQETFNPTCNRRDLLFYAATAWCLGLLGYRYCLTL